MGLRDYQNELVNAALHTKFNVLMQADTGSGKTRILAELSKNANSIVVGHRNLLVSQLSMEFARNKIDHQIYATQSTIRHAKLMQRRELGAEVKNSINCTICSIDKIISDYKRGSLNLDTDAIKQVLVDEAHHMISENKWGLLSGIFPNAQIIGATATPIRLDGVSLQRDCGGVFDKLIQANSLTRDSVSKLIERGYISEFKCYGVDSRIDNSRLKHGKHDYTYDSLNTETFRKIHLTAGDAVSHYKRLANNTLAVAFCPGINVAEEVAKAFRAKGVSSAVIHSKMGTRLVRKTFQDFKNKIVKVLVSVDMIGEGIDIPTIETAILLRKTASLGLYRQWVGRTLRPSHGKKYSIIIDHADNIRTHGLPDRDIQWSLSGALNVSEKTNLVHCKNCGFINKGWANKCEECDQQLRIKENLTEYDLQFIDVRLVELHKSKALKKSANAVLAADVDPHHIKYMVKSGCGISETETRIALWFFDTIRNQATVGEVEDFMFKNNNIEFWSKNFKFSDINTEKEKKIKRVWNENRDA